jgi:hypothetical protein
MPFRIGFAGRGRDDLGTLEANPAYVKRLKAVRAALGKLQINPRHPGLNTHKYSTMHGENGEEVFETYAENNTLGGCRRKLSARKKAG